MATSSIYDSKSSPHRGKDFDNDASLERARHSNQTSCAQAYFGPRMDWGIQ
jgi:hypothetical protein